MTDAPNGHPRDRLSEYLDDELDIEAREAIDRHLAACEDCRAELGALRRLREAMASEEVPPVPVDLAARIGRSLDAATIVRPRARRFVIPTTIAATIGAIGLLVALQWRDGRLGTPAVPQPEVAPELKESPARDALEKDVKPIEPRAVEERQKQKKAEGAPGGVVGGVTGGIVSGGAGDVADASPREAGADDERRDRGASKVANEAAAAPVPAPESPREFAPVPAPPAPSSPAPSSVAGRVQGGIPGGVPGGRSRCAERWSDSGLRGNWEVPDVEAAARDLSRIARDVSGTSVWHGVDDGRPYVLVVPRARFEEVFYALRARGVSGFPDTPPAAEGNDCTGIWVALAVATESPSPPR